MQRLHGALRSGAPFTANCKRVDCRTLQPEYALFITNFARLISVVVTCLQQLDGTAESRSLKAWFLCLWSLLGLASTPYTEWSDVLQLDKSVYWEPSPSEAALHIGLLNRMTWMLHALQRRSWVWLLLYSDTSLPSVRSQLRVLLLRLPLDSLHKLALMSTAQSATAAATQLCALPPKFLPLLCCLACNHEENHNQHSSAQQLQINLKVIW